MEIRKFANMFFKWVEETRQNQYTKNDRICPDCGGLYKCTCVDFFGKGNEWKCESCGRESFLWSGGPFPC